MAYEESLRSITLDADSSLSGYTGVPGLPGSANPNYGKQYRWVKVTGAHQVGLATAQTDTIVGVIQNKPQVTGQAGTVAVQGVTNVITGGAITAGAKVTCDSNGLTVAAGGSDRVLGVAILSAGAAGQLTSVLMQVN